MHPSLLLLAIAGAAFVPPPQPAPAPTAVPATIAQVAWLAGAWAGTLGPAAIEEHWTTAGGGAMLAVARTVRSERLVAFEYLRIVERDGTLVYVAMPGGRSPATEFVLTAIDEASATFSNPSHDFPKAIRYALTPEGALEATISDGGRKSQTFRFGKRK